MKFKAILFDLDGTLLPMDNDEFVKIYFKLLAGKAIGWGYNPETIVDGIWTGTKAMIVNDGSCLNVDDFCNTFDKVMEKDTRADIQKFDGFYTNEFHQAKVGTGENPLAREAVELAREKAGTVVLATNPLFPPCGVDTRMGWVGLNSEDFALVTNYENSHFCKPNPDYYREILQKLNLQPEDCLMIGNDMDEDIIPTKGLGMKNFLLTDSLINRGNKSLDEADAHGTFADLITYLKAL